MTRTEAQQLAKHIARKVFECGDEKDAKVRRIQFMSGRWPNEESMLGGLCEHALENVIFTAIQSRMHEEWNW